MTTTALLACLMAAAVGALLFAEGTQRKGFVFVCKPVASACFLAVGWSLHRAGDPYGAWVLLGLALSVAGDVLLMFRAAFLAGLVVFLLAHVAYLAAFHALLPAHAWPLPLAAPVVTVSVLAASWLWPHLGRMRGSVLAYVAVITSMVWGALAVTVAGSLGVASATGAVLFYLSDLSVARDRFVRAGFVNRAWGLPAYYLGQFLLALSVARSGV